MSLSAGLAEAVSEARVDPDYLRIEKVSKRFGSTTVLSDLDLAVGRGEFVSLLGPSGCGKTTLLRIVAGMLAPERGQVAVGGRNLTRVQTHRRNIGVVFQNYALFPHLTVAENIAFGLRAQRLPAALIGERVKEALAMVRLEDFADRRILALSGGQQQRVAVARATVVKPALLLLDEPFSSLDRKLRETMQIELRHLLRDLDITSIFVTHDQDEALVMSDRIAVMNAGRIEHLDTPARVYARPNSLFVMEFVGQSTRLGGTAAGGEHGSMAIDTGQGRLRAPGSFMAGSAVVLGIRPEAIELGEGPGDAFNTVRARLRDIVFFGARTMLYFEPANPADRILVDLARLPGGLAPGATVTLRWPVAETLVFPAP
ncbi:MAG: ABC transporter ATP-binding protein [Alphaproteobacteria bacterium]|nr:ABC transporter ATP-binding protein [Alphaproteobacteria bacterium]